MSPTRIVTRTSLLLLLAFTLSACISHQQYRTQYDPCISAKPDTDCITSAVQEFQNQATPEENYSLGFIEFDDQGQLWDRQQMQKVTGQLWADSANQELLMVVFVHGWKHNAKVGDDNIDSFRQTLRRLSVMESRISEMTGNKPRKVAGVYLGWRGGSVSLWGAKELTFWDRKSTAHTVGYGGVTEVLSQLEQLQKTKREIARRDNQESSTRLVIVGHSFGGAVVYSALSELLENRFVQTLGPNSVVSNPVGVADLVVLINPAFEAMRYAPLWSMATERRSYFDNQLPVLAILTSEADWATKYAFPAGRLFSTLFETERKEPFTNPVTKAVEEYGQGKANVTTVGHFDDFKTHYLKASAELKDDEEMKFNLAGEMSLFKRASLGWEGDHPGSKIVFDGSTLERTANSVGRNPYLNIYVDKELIHDHNDINDPRIETFVRQLILIATQNQQLEKRRAVRKKLVSE